MNKKVILATLATITLAACSNDDEQYADFTSPVEVNFSAQVRGTTARTASTRDDNSDETANTTDTWSNGGHDKIGVTLTTLSTNSTQSVDDFRNILYTTKSTGSTTTKTSFTIDDATNKFYFQTPKEYAYFSAYAPYTLSTGVDGNNNIKVEPSTSNTDGISVPDYIWAETGKLNYSNASPTLAFNHKMAQLQVVVKLGESVSVEQPSANVDEPSTYSSQIESVKLSNITREGTFNIGTGAVTLGDSKASASLSADNGSEGQTATSPVYTILPQSGITVTITTDGVADHSDVNSNTYQVTLPELIAGNSYVYTITAQKTEVEVSATIKEWESEEGTLTASMIRVIKQFDTFDDPSLAKQYDLAFSDGTFMRMQDENGELPSEISSGVLTDELKAKLSGIVYWIGDVTVDDAVLGTQHSNCTHGLIVALNDVEKSYFNWQDTPECVYTNYQQNSAYSGYKRIQISNVGNPTDDDVALLQAKTGYSNTAVLQAYNATKESSSKYLVLPVTYIESYASSNKAPAESSGWYLGSPMEIGLLCDEVSEIKLNTSGAKSYNVWTNLNSIFSILSNKNVNTEQFSSNGVPYWTSMEAIYNSSDEYACRMYIYDSRSSDGKYAYMEAFKKNDGMGKGCVRPICAF
jgi:hypothetical protein